MSTNSVVIVLMYIFSRLLSETLELMDDDIIATINNMNTTWTARKNPFRNLSLRILDLESLPGTEPRNYFGNDVTRVFHDLGFFTLPESFDSRKHWPYCSDIISTVMNEGICRGGTWAFAAASVMSDRICIESEGKTKVNLSAEDLMACCPTCSPHDYGCQKGDPLEAFKFWVKTGLVTGGPHHFRKTGCRPYSSSSYNWGAHTHCLQHCTNEKYKFSYKSDKYKGNSYYATARNTIQIRLDILRHGPVTATFEFHTDFHFFGEGVYRPIVKEKSGVRVVKILGWGTEDGTPYWLVANSWGDDWAERGMFKYIRGKNAGKIESYIVAGKVYAKLLSSHEGSNMSHSSARSMQDIRQKLVMVGVFSINWFLAY